MHFKILVIYLVLINTVFSQNINHFICAKKTNDNFIINQKIAIIENTIKAGSYKDVKESLLSIKKESNVFSKYSKKKTTSTYTPIEKPKYFNFEIEKINNSNDETTISCVANLIYDKNKKDIPFILYFNKINNIWSIADDDNMLSTISRAFVESTKTRSVQTNSTEVEIIDNSKTLIPVKYSSIYNVWEINKSLANSNFPGIDFCSKNSEVDVNIYVYGPDPYKSESVYLLSDPVYGRILFVNQEEGKFTNDYEIKSYGDHVGEFKFQNPIAIAVGENGDLFVADIGLNKIIKLKYFPNTNTIAYQQTINVAGLGKPSDISYCKSYASTWPARLVIVDMLNQSLLQVDLNGNILTTTTGFSDQSGYQPFNHIERVATNRFDGYVALIDNGLKKVIQGLIINNTNYIFLYNVAESFSYLSNFSDIAICPNNEYLVSDIGLNKVHKFSFEGDYICSFSNSPSNFGGFNLPKRISSVANNFDGRVILETDILSVWSDNSGGRRFFQNSDVFNINHSIDENYFHFNFTLTSYSKINLKILKNGVSQWSKSYSMISGGYHEENIPRSGFNFGEYVFSIEYKQLYDEYYQQYEQGWKTKSIVFTNEPVLPSVISSNMTISGAYLATSSTTINSGVTLTVEAGASITFQNGATLIVDGTLDVNGTTTNKVTFDFIAQNSTLKNGIKINSGGTANISNAEIKNAYNGVYVNGGSATIDGCIIRNGYNGIQLYDTDYTTSIKNTRIYEQTVGVDMYYSTAVISYSEIDNNYIGISCYSSSPQLIYRTSSGGYNNIHANSFGIMASYNSNPFLGRQTCFTFGGSNIIDLNTTKDINLNNYCTVYAENNYWGGSSGSYYEGTGCIVYDTPFLTSPPQMSQNKIKITPEEEMFNNKFPPQVTSSANSTEQLSLVTSSNEKSGYNESWQIEWKLLYARNLMRVKKYNQAAKICESVITEFPDSARSYLALDLLWQSRKNDDKTLFKQYVDNKAKSKVKKQLYGVAELMLAFSERANTADSKERVAGLDVIGEKYKDTPLVEHVLFQKFMFYLYEENNIELAKTTSAELGKLFPESESYYASQRHLGNDVVKPTEPLLAKNAANEETTEIPKTYELLGNYPNPFNPSTTIKYALPYSSNVELTIYDITGKVVKVFSESGQSAGYQNIVWFGDSQQGSRVSSGVYLYRFKATSIDGSNKVFEKTAKILLLK